MITPEFSAPKVITVSQLNFYIKSLLDNDAHLNTVFITGEISNFTDHYKSGHLYLSLKDETSVIRAVMFAGNARRLKFRPQEGMKVIARGRVSLYEPSGQYQLYIEDMQPDGVGALTLAFEQLKKALSEKGLFAREHKKAIPKFPRRVGVITSPTGAAVQDIRNILMRRFPCADIVMYPVLVQGGNAAEQLVQAVNTFSEYRAADVVIIGRGGGSVEDLWAFNNERLAYAVYNCCVPVISAVGHETDFTICDFVADLRAPTPSAAAELAVPDRKELLSFYDGQKQYLNSMLEAKLQLCRKNLLRLQKTAESMSPDKQIRLFYQNLNTSAERLENASSACYAIIAERIKAAGAKLESLNPVSVLNRGYSIAEKDGKVIHSVEELNPEDTFRLSFKDGKIQAKVIGE